MTRRRQNGFTESSRAKCNQHSGRNVVAPEASETCLSVVTSVSAHYTFPTLSQPLDLTCANSIFRSAGVGTGQFCLRSPSRINVIPTRQVLLHAFWTDRLRRMDMSHILLQASIIKPIFRSRICRYDATCHLFPSRG